MKIFKQNKIVRSSCSRFLILYVAFIKVFVIPAHAMSCCQYSMACHSPYQMALFNLLTSLKTAKPQRLPQSEKPCKNDLLRSMQKVLLNKNKYYMIASFGASQPVICEH